MKPNHRHVSASGMNLREALAFAKVEIGIEMGPTWALNLGPPS